MSIDTEYKNYPDDTGIDFKTFDMKEELKKFEDCVVKPIDALIRLYTEPKEFASGLMRPDSNVDIDKAVMSVGYVAKLGSDAFNAERYNGWKGSFYEVGDWVVFPRQYGTRFQFKGLTVFSIYDDAILLKVKDPRDAC